MAAEKGKTENADLKKCKDFSFPSSTKLYNDRLMKLSSSPWSAKEQCLVFRSHVAEAWKETKNYEPFPQPEGIAGVPMLAANTVGKGVYLLLKGPDALVHAVVDPNEPSELLDGPMRRTRQKLGSILGRVTNGDIFKKPIRTVATMAYETVFELTQNAALDLPETLSGNTSNTRSRFAATLAA